MASMRGAGAVSSRPPRHQLWPSCRKLTAKSFRHAEPFGPLDSIVVVDSEAELLAAMNASNGSLVASVATDDLDFGARIAEELQAFKVGNDGHYRYPVVADLIENRKS